mmetsp:Transcript_41373/g.81736  ORF Transcript_41373/g.81736 Transcript_41373/m.81736 type:complete len:249 (-) Transcript_41373:7-753(-)
MACSQCSLFSHAVMAAFQATSSGSMSNPGIDFKSSSASLHCEPLAQALMTALHTTTLGGGPLSLICTIKLSARVPGSGAAEHAVNAVLQDTTSTSGPETHMCHNIETASSHCLARAQAFMAALHTIVSGSTLCNPHCTNNAIASLQSFDRPNADMAITNSGAASKRPPACRHSSDSKTASGPRRSSRKRNRIVLRSGPISQRLEECCLNCGCAAGAAAPEEVCMLAAACDCPHHCSILQTTAVVTVSS